MCSGELIKRDRVDLEIKGKDLPLGSEQRKEDENVPKERIVNVLIDDPREGETKNWKSFPLTNTEVFTFNTASIIMAGGKRTTQILRQLYAADFCDRLVQFVKPWLYFYFT